MWQARATSAEEERDEAARRAEEAAQLAESYSLELDRAQVSCAFAWLFIRGTDNCAGFRYWPNVMHVVLY